MGKFLITGGCGFIGSHLVDELISRGDRVRVLDNLSTGKIENLAPNVEFIEGDITNRNTVLECVSGVDGIFHLAAIASVNRTTMEWPECHAVNLTGCINVFDAASRVHKSPIPVTYASSAAVYGDLPTLVPRHESETPHPVSAYGADKYGCELHARVATLVHKIPTVGLRLFNIYGPRQDPTSPYAGVISIFANRMHRNLPVNIYGDGNQVRDFVYVRDAVRFFVSAMNADHAAANVFNVCTGHGTSITALAQYIGESCGRTPEIHFMPARPGDIRHSVGNPDAALKWLECKAETPTRLGLAMTLNAEINRVQGTE